MVLYGLGVAIYQGKWVMELIPIDMLRFELEQQIIGFRFRLETVIPWQNAPIIPFGFGELVCMDKWVWVR